MELTSESVKYFLISNNLLNDDDFTTCIVSISQNDLDSSYIKDIYTIKRHIALENNNTVILKFIDTLLKNLSDENNDVKIRFISIKGNINQRVVTNSLLSKVYAILNLDTNENSQEI
jgi:hypothetical protein